jgi:hypothetical protein
VVVDGVLTMRMRNREERARLYAIFITYEAGPTFDRLEAMMRPTGERSHSKTTCNWADLAVFDVVRTLERTLPQSQQLMPAGRFPQLTAVVQVSYRRPRRDPIEAPYHTPILCGWRGGREQAVGAIPEVAEHLRSHPYTDLHGLFAQPVPSLRDRCLQLLGQLRSSLSQLRTALTGGHAPAEEEQWPQAAKEQ